MLSIMKVKIDKAKINGIKVEGRGHLQPGINNWIGIFVVGDDLLEDDSRQWPSVVVDYEGPLNCEEECTNGKGKAKIIHVRPHSESNKFMISIQGIDKPILDKQIDKNAQFHYNSNLPPVEAFSIKKTCKNS